MRKSYFFSARAEYLALASCSGEATELGSWMPMLKLKHPSPLCARPCESHGSIVCTAFPKGTGTSLVLFLWQHQTWVRSKKNIERKNYDFLEMQEDWDIRSLFIKQNTTANGGRTDWMDSLAFELGKLPSEHWRQATHLQKQRTLTTFIERSQTIEEVFRCSQAGTSTCQKHHLT